MSGASKSKLDMSEESLYVGHGNDEITIEKHNKHYGGDWRTFELFRIDFRLDYKSDDDVCAIK
jgi:hypothetical protein